MYPNIPSTSYFLQVWERAISILSLACTHILHSGLSFTSDVVTKSWPTWGSSARWLTARSSSDKLWVYAGQEERVANAKLGFPLYETAETITVLTSRSRGLQPSAHCIFYGLPKKTVMCWLEEALLTERRRDGARCSVWILIADTRQGNSLPFLCCRRKSLYLGQGVRIYWWTCLCNKHVSNSREFTVYPECGKVSC